MTVTEPYDHVRAGRDAPVTEGTYRVVGRDGEHVVILYVADASGERVHSGRTERVDADRIARDFEEASNPDAGFSVSDVLDPFSAFLTQIRYVLGI